MDAADAPMPVIVGPTAGGKTALSIGLARELAGRGIAAEIVSADAFQVYRGMDIGTAKPSMEERGGAGGVPHHLIDVAEPTERFTLMDWLAAAEGAIKDVRSRGAVPVVVGGTHLYVKALLDGVFEGPEPDDGLREALRGMGLAAMRAELERVDPAAAGRIHPNDERRTVRALEVFRQTGTPISDLQRQWDAGRNRHDAVLVGLEWPAEAINRRINARVRAMAEAGLVDEVRGLVTAGRLGEQAGQALGYKQVAMALDGRMSVDDAIEKTKIETRRFAKNQRTWLRRLRAGAGGPDSGGGVWAAGASVDVGAIAGCLFGNK